MMTSNPQAKCDECGKLYENGDALYTIASKFDDDGNLISFRHWDCHVPIEMRLKQLKDVLSKGEDIFNHLKDKF